MNYLYAEIQKQRKLKIIYVSLGFIFMSIFIGTGLFVANKEIMEKEKFSILLWGQSAFYYSNLLSPILAGIVSSMILLIDTNKKNFRRLKSAGVNLNKVIVSKMIVMFMYSLLIQIMFLICFIISSKISGVSIKIEEMIKFMEWAFYGAFGLSVIMSLAMCIFISIDSFTGTVGLTVVGTFISFIILFINEGISKYFPFSLVVVGMRARSLISMNFTEVLYFMFTSTGFVILFTIISLLRVKKFLE